MNKENPLSGCDFDSADFVAGCIKDRIENPYIWSEKKEELERDLGKNNYKYTDNLGVLVGAFLGSSSSPLSLERRLNIINLLSGLCESEGISVSELIRNFNVELVEKHLDNPKVKGFFLIAGKVAPQSKLTDSEIETVMWVASEISKYHGLLRE